MTHIRLKLVKISDSSDKDLWAIERSEFDENRPISTNSTQESDTVQFHDEKIIPECIQQSQHHSLEMDPDAGNISNPENVPEVPQIEYHDLSEPSDDEYRQLFPNNVKNSKNRNNHIDSAIPEFIEPQLPFDYVEFFEGLEFLSRRPPLIDHTYGLPSFENAQFGQVFYPSSRQPIEIQSYYSNIHAITYYTINAIPSPTPTAISFTTASSSSQERVANDLFLQPSQQHERTACKTDETAAQKLLSAHHSIVYPKAEVQLLGDRPAIATDLSSHRGRNGTGPTFVCQHRATNFDHEHTSLGAHSIRHLQPDHHRLYNENVFHSVFSRHKLTSILKYSYYDHRPDFSVINSKAGIFICESCYSIQPSSNHLAYHVNKFHPVYSRNCDRKLASRPFYCYFCDDSFPRKKQLNIHVRIYHQFVCNICNVYLISEKYFKIHVRQHCTLRKSG